MYQITLRARHDCAYSRIASLFDTPMYEFCSDLFDMLIIPQRLSEAKIKQISEEVEDPASLEICVPEYNENLSYVYFSCMCDRSTSVVPTIERHGGIVQHPIRYEDGYEYYEIINLNAKTQQAVLGVTDHLQNIEIISIRELGREGIFQAQFLPVSVLMQSLTDRQIEVITKAYQKGYYEIPRTVRTKDLAKEFEVSRAATEKSLRKAENQILENIISYLLMHQKLYNPDTPKRLSLSIS